MGILSDEDKAKFRSVLEGKEREYTAKIDQFAQGNTICYPAQSSAISKAEAELKARKSIPSSTLATLKKAQKEAAGKLKAWRRELAEVEVTGEKNLFLSLEALVGRCGAALNDVDTGPMESIIDVIKNPGKFGLNQFTASSLAAAHWNKLSTLLHREGAVDSLLSEMEAGQKEIVTREQIVRRNIEAGQFRRRPGGAIPLPEEHDSGPENFDPRQ